MKKISWTGILLIMTLLISCNKQKNPASQVKPNGLPKSEAAAEKGGVAIVDIDTIAAKYEYCIEGQKALEAKQNSYRQQLNSKGQSLQKAMESFQQKLQSGAYSSQEQAEKAQRGLQQQQQSLQNFQTKIENEMMEATQAYQQVLRDSINSFLKEYNSDGRFKVILSKSGDNVLYAEPAADITADVVTGLNKRYKKK